MLKMTMSKRDHATDHLKKGLLISIGSISVVLGVIGIIVPLLPTTPFLLLAAACYVAVRNDFIPGCSPIAGLGSISAIIGKGAECHAGQKSW